MRPSVVCINPWVYDFAAYDMWARPLGLLTIAELLRRCAVTVHFVDCLDRGEGGAVAGRRSPRHDPYGCGKFRHEVIPKPAVLEPVPRKYKRYGMPEQHFEARLAPSSVPDAVLVTCAMTYWYPGAFDAIRRVKARWPTTPALLGGPYAALCPDHARHQSGADIVVESGGLPAALEAVSRAIGQELAPRPPWERARPPRPAYDLINHQGAAAVLTGRGCPYRCSYCASWRIEPEFYRFETVHVADTIEHLVRREGVRDIAFYDDALLVDAERHLLPILAELKSRKVSVRFHTPNGLHARFVDASTARALRDSRFTTVCLSYESSNPERQRDSCGKVTTDQLGAALEALRSAGFTHREVSVYALMGLPGQDEGEVAETLETIHRLGARSCLAQYSPIPGTRDFELWDHPNRELARRGPLLHNNTAFPYLHGGCALDPGQCQRLRVLSRWLNEGVQIGTGLQHLPSRKGPPARG